MPAQFPAAPALAQPRTVDTGNPQTLSDVLRPHGVPFADLKNNYPFIAILKTLLGVAPNSLTLVALFPPAFATENLIVPALLNLPASMFWAGTNLRQAGLCMFAASRQSGCQYCTLHCATYSLRRGLPETSLALDGLEPDEEACVGVGRALGSLPCSMTPEVYEALIKAKGDPEGAESIMLTGVMMGWLGRMMDSLGLDMEEALVKEVDGLLHDLGWSTGQHAVGKPLDALQVPDSEQPRRADSVASRLEVLRHLPSAAMFDIRETANMPSTAEDVLSFLEENVGYAFPILARILRPAARKGIAAGIFKNLISDSCSISLSLKGAIGIAHAMFAENETLAQAMEGICVKAAKEDASAKADAALLVDLVRTNARSSAGMPEIDAEWISGVFKGFRDGGLTEKDAAVTTLGIAASTSPGRVSPAVVSMAADNLAPSEMIEVISWLGCVTMVIRLEAYYAVVPTEP